MDTTSCERYRDLGQNLWDGSSGSSMKGNILRNLTLGPVQRLPSAFPFGSSLSIGSVGTYCLICESLGASGWYEILIPTAKEEMEIKAELKKPEVTWKCILPTVRCEHAGSRAAPKIIASWSKTHRGDGKPEPKTAGRQF